ALTAVTFGALHDCAALLFCVNRTFDTCHAFYSLVCSPKQGGKLLVTYLNNGELDAEHATNTCYIALCQRHIWLQTTLVARWLMLEVVTAIRAFAHQLSRPGDAEALTGTIMSFHFRHCGRSFISFAGFRLKPVPALYIRPCVPAPASALVNLSTDSTLLANAPGLGPLSDGLAACFFSSSGNASAIEFFGSACSTCCSRSRRAAAAARSRREPPPSRGLCAPPLPLGVW